MFYVPRDNWSSRGRGLVGTPGAVIFSPLMSPLGAPFCTTAAAQVATGKPVNTAAPVVSGSLAQGQTLATTNGSWSQPVTSYAYKWQTSPNGSTGWADIAAQTTSTYATQVGDVGNYIRSGVQATNAFGADVAGYVPSAAVGPITGAGSAINISFDQSDPNHSLNLTL